MAQLLIAAAGAALGGAALGSGVIALGMTGAQIGWAVGSLIGSQFGPTQKSQGPRLGDLTVGTSAYGSTIPYVAGSPRLAAQIIWASSKREIATTTEEGGKGGGGAEYTSYSYEIDLMILLADNEIDGIRRVWSAGKLIWTSDTDATYASLQASTEAPQWASMTVYTGGPAQLPDPTYEAAVGTANAPAYRGRGTVMIQGLQLGQSGQIPNLTFEVLSDAETATTGFNRDVTNRHVWAYNAYATPTTDNLFGTHAANIAYLLGDTFYSNIYADPSFDTTTLNFGLSDFTIELWHKPAFLTGFMLAALGDSGSKLVQISIGITGPTLGAYEVQFNHQSQIGDPYLYGGLVTVGVWAHLVLQRIGNTLTFYVDGVAKDSMVLTATDMSFDNLTKIALGSSYAGIIDQFRVSTTARYDPDGFDVPVSRFLVDGNTRLQLDFDVLPTIAPGSISLAAVVSRVCLRAGMASTMFDVTALASITAPVHSMAITQVSSARAVLEMLMSVYFFDAVLSDKIYFRPRGGASVANLTFDDLGVTTEGSGPIDPLPLTIANDLEIPAQMALTYTNIDADYQPDTQYSDRLLTGQSSTDTVQVPLGFAPSDAKRIIDTMLADRATTAIGVTIALSVKFTRLEPADVVTVTGEDDSIYRLRLLKRTEARGVISFDAVLDEATVLEQEGITSEGPAAGSGVPVTQTVVATPPETTAKLLDIPQLRDADNVPMFYVAAKNSAGSSSGFYSSRDDITYEQLTTIPAQSVWGYATTVLGPFNGLDVWDDISTLMVGVGDGVLASATKSAILLDQTLNAALVGDEIVQFSMAVLVSPGIYILHGFLRGRRGTDGYRNGHVSAERFVVLSNDVRSIEVGGADLGKLRYYKAVSPGQKLSSVVAQIFTPTGVGQECFSPVDLRANRNTTDTVLTWKRRTRMFTRLVGPLAISAPLGEDIESYEIDIFSSATYLTLKRTVASNTPTITYTNAQQVTDFGVGQTILYCKVYQLSASMGRGFPLTASA